MSAAVKRCILLCGLSSAAIVLAACFFIDRVAMAGIERVGPLLLGADVRVGSVLISPLTGRGIVRRLVVGNPPGFKTDAALRARSIRVDVSIPSLFTRTWVIRRVVVDRPEITYEGGLGGSNVSKLLANIERFSPSGASKSTRRYVVRRFVVRGARVRVSARMLGGKALHVPMGDLQVSDIGAKDGQTGASLRDTAVAVFSPVATAVSKTASEQGKSLAREAGRQADKALKSLKSFLK